MIATEPSLFKDIGAIFHPLLVGVGYFIALIYGIVHTYAISITILTIVIMGLLTPLTIKGTKSMLAMQAMQPELQKLRQKYKGPENREQLNAEMMRIYKDNNINPVTSCLPMFLQMPALYILYDVLRGLTNSIKKHVAFPKGTVLYHGTQTIVASGHQKCMATVCAVPRYIPSSSTMYKHLVATPGVMKSFGMNLALRPFTHHAHWYDAIPFFVFVLLAVGLQYIQMNQMTKRNKAMGKANNQMVMMQRVMPLFMAYIYFLIPAGVVIYMIISSAIRILTQDLMFRSGIVQLPGNREIEIGGSKDRKVVDAKATEIGPAKKATGASNGKALTAGKQTPGKQAAAKPTATKTANGTGGSGGTEDTTADEDEGAKSHPRSKDKRARKAR